MDFDEAPKTLLLVAEAAQDVAAGLNKFVAPVSTSAAEITELVSKCFAISAALQNLAKAVKSVRQISRYKSFQDEISDVTYSLDYTFKDVHQIVGEGFKEARDEGFTQITAFRQIWWDINDYFQTESGNNLSRRLDHCQAFLQKLTGILVEGSAVIWSVSCLALTMFGQITAGPGRLQRFGK